MISVNPGHNEIRVFENDPDLIIKGGMIITMREGQNPIQEGEIFIKNGKITRIHASETESNSGYSHAEIINAKDAIIMPGLINAHTHTAMTLFRGLADDLPLKQWLFEKIFPAEARFLNPDTVYWGSLLGCLEMIASGTTSFIDGYFFQDATVRAAHESGLRALIAQGVIDFPAPGVDDPEKNLKVAKEFIERWRGFSDRIIPGIFCHSPLTCSKQTLKDAWEISQQFDLPLQIHLSETAGEVNEILKKIGKRPVHYLEEIGLIDDGLIAAHAVHLDDSEIECLKENGVRIVHLPESNMKLSSGVARILDMVKKEIPIGLGTDGCSSNNNLDLFQEMDTAAKLSKVFSLDPVALNAETVLRMTTTWGASVMGMGDQVGTLELGKKADIIVVDLRGPNLCPVYDPLSALVYTASGADVKDVIVDGKVLMKDRTFTTLDANEIMERVKRISKEIMI